MKLYELSRDSLFMIDEEGYRKDIFRLEKLDGMYSRCYDDQGQLIHLAGFTPVIKVGDWIPDAKA